MTPILEKIVSHKRLEVLSSEQAISSQQLKDSMYYHRETFSAKSALRFGGIIAEHKRKSPSKKSINLSRPLVDTIDRYARGGASAISVLTDTQFFGGSLTDLALARASCSLPIIRKDFIISTYQIDEAKAYGADFILLIAAILSPNQIQEFTAYAHALGLEVLLEVHDKEELLTNNNCPVDLVGVNHRNLKTFETNLDLGIELLPEIDKNQIAVAESGIHTKKSLKKLWKAGFKGFLIGESIMKHKAPEVLLAKWNNCLK